MGTIKTLDVIKKRMGLITSDQLELVGTMIGFIHNQLINMESDKPTPSEWVIVQALCNYIDNQEDTTEANVIKDWFDRNDLTFVWDEGSEQYVLMSTKDQMVEEDPTDIELAWDCGQEAAQGECRFQDNPYRLDKEDTRVLRHIWEAGYLEYDRTKVLTSIKLKDNS